MIQLPHDYIRRVQAQLGPEADAFLASYDEPRAQGLRLNPLKAEADSAFWRSLSQQWHLEPVPWCPTGYYYGEAARPGRHPLHAAGLYYIQEPSAMSSVELLDPQPGDIVLDLAAAPGGKTTQIAGKLAGSGLLIANEIHPARAKILSENVERMGIANAVVMSEPPDRLASRFAEFFDKIMLDAPCSGEGMFRKDPEAVREWSHKHVEMCAARQSDILREAVRMLKPGGRLGYSTCTFNREENEETVASLLRQHPEFELLRCERIWPHLQRGEGHFVATLRKRADAANQAVGTPAQLSVPGKRGGKTKKPPKEVEEAAALFADFAVDRLPGYRLPPGEPLLFGEQLYWLPRAAGCSFGAAHLRGLKTVRPGLHLAEVKKNRIEPAHALAHAVPAQAAASVHETDAGSAEAAAYLSGHTFHCGADASGWTLVTAGDFPLGWGKASGGQLKNHYPKGLRWPG